MAVLPEIVSAFIVVIATTSRRHRIIKHLRPCVDAISGANVPEAAVFDRVIGSLNAYSSIVRLV